jgi:membrane protease YdiL (CAAX protease family)
MNKLYQKNQLLFAILWIVVYVIAFSAGDNLSASFGVEKSVTVVVGGVLTVVLVIWIYCNGLSEEYGLCLSKLPAGKMLYYLPLVLLASVNLWFGVTLNLTVLETVLYIIAMFFVGFLEEIIFRGLLFKAMAKDNLKTAMIVSSLTFGLGHIVNLFNGSGMDLASSITQIVLAVLLGFVLVLIFYYGKSLIPCILFHSANNALQVFSADGSLDPQTEMVLNLVVIAIVLGGYSLYLVRAFSMKEK